MRSEQCCRSFRGLGLVRVVMRLMSLVQLGVYYVCGNETGSDIEVIMPGVEVTGVVEHIGQADIAES